METQKVSTTFSGEIETCPFFVALKFSTGFPNFRTLELPPLSCPSCLSLLKPDLPAGGVARKWIQYLHNISGPAIF